MTYQPVSLENLLTHHGWAMRVARRLVHEEGEAEDLVQRTWMAALQRPPQSEGGARAWIRKVILNLARERHRRERARAQVEQRERTDLEVPDALETLSREEIHRLLGERLMRLEEPYREVVLKRFYEDLSSVEIAQHMGIPAGTVRWRLKMGLDQLRAELDRRAKGDRARWVSALLFFLRPDPREPGATQATGAGLPLAAAGGSLLALALAGRWFLQGDSVATAHAAAPLEVTALEAKDGNADAAGIGDRRESLLLPNDAHSSHSAPMPSAEGLLVRVVDPAGRAVSAARVLVAEAGGFRVRAETDAAGEARLIVRDSDRGALGLEETRGRVSIRALAKGCVASKVLHVAEPFTSAHEVRLAVGGPDDVLEGRVVDPEDRPVEGAVVAWFVAMNFYDHGGEQDFSSPGFLTAPTDAQGRFQLAHRPRGTGNIACFAPGFAVLSEPHDGDPRHPTVLRLSRGATVSGRVRGPNGANTAGVRVSCETIFKADEWAAGLPHYVPEWRGFSELTTTDADGRFLLQGIGQGRRTLWAVDERSRLVATTRLELKNDERAEWEADLAEHARFRLRLVDENERPLAGWFAYLRLPLDAEWWVRRVAADDEGRVEILDCREDLVFLDVFPPTGLGVSRAWRRLRPSADEQLIRVDTNVAIPVRGRVLDADGRPDLGGDLTLFSGETSYPLRLERDEQGCFSTQVVPGQYLLVLQRPHTATGLGSFRARRGETQDFGELFVPATGTLRLGVSPSGARGTVHYNLHKLADSGRALTSLGVSQGVLEGELLLDVYPGRYRLSLSDDSGTASQDLLVRANEETRPEMGR